MLQKIALMDAAVIRGLLVAVVGLLGLVLSFFGVDENLFSDKAERVVDALMLVLTAGGLFWAGWARVSLPTPPVSDKAVAKTVALMHKQGGFLSSAMLGILLIVGALGVAVTLTGCAELGLQQPKTFEERWAYAQSQTTAIRETSTRALNAGLIDSADMEYTIGVADRSSELLRLARTAASAGDTKTAEGRLQLVTTILAELEGYLQKRSAQR